LPSKEVLASIASTEQTNKNKRKERKRKEKNKTKLDKTKNFITFFWVRWLEDLKFKSMPGTVSKTLSQK
jgi:hypothetical protein